MIRNRTLLLPALVSVLLTGCLPYGCNRIESRVLLPADSVARALAEAIPVDTLVVLATPGLPEVVYPRTLAYGPDGTLWVSDTGENRVLRWSGDGEAEVLEMDSLRFPYLAGFRNGEPVVFSPADARMAAAGGTWSLDTPTDLPNRVLQYAVVSDSLIWMKIAGEGFPSHLVRFAADGSEMDRIALPAPFWRWAGALRLRDDRLVSLSGYRPQVYTFEGGQVDSIRLSGFDSPMLARSRGFLIGEVSQPPLLTPSAAWLGETLFVLNVRPGWLRVDVYDADLKLTRILVEPDPAFGKEFYPTDLAVRRNSSGEVEVAVSLVEPAPGVRRFRVPE